MQKQFLLNWPPFVHEVVVERRREDHPILTIGVPEARHERDGLVEEDGGALHDVLVDTDRLRAFRCHIHKKSVPSDEEHVLLPGGFEHVRELNVLHHGLHARSGVEAHRAEVALWLRRAHVEEGQLVIHDGALPLCKSVLPQKLLEMPCGISAEVPCR
jgi:hypothetical protein